MDSFTLVIFGITSNLAQIKLIPTLYDLVAGGAIDSDFSVIGVGRTPMDQAQFNSFISKTLRTPNRHHTHAIDEKI
jgi:glucose-6-phosphate 1-dehydrogenase